MINPSAVTDSPKSNCPSNGMPGTSLGEEKYPAGCATDEMAVNLRISPSKPSENTIRFFMGDRRLKNFEETLARERAWLPITEFYA